MWNSVVSELVSALWVFSSHSAAFGSGRLFSSMPSRSSSVFPTAPALPGRALQTQPNSGISRIGLLRVSLVNVRIFSARLGDYFGGRQKSNKYSNVVPTVM